MISLLTASLPERQPLLAEACASVAAQTLKPAVHLIGVDYARRGAEATYNALSEQVETEWLTFLDDDDLLDPHHLEVLAANLSDDVDVVYTGCRTEGHQFPHYNQTFNPNLLLKRSIVPITACVRTSTFRDLKFVKEWGYDWRLWQRIHRAGGKFLAVPQITWTYRRTAYGNQSHGELAS